MPNKPIRAIAMDSKYGSMGKIGSFQPSKPANLSRPTNIKMPPPPRSKAS